MVPNSCVPHFQQFVSLPAFICCWYLVLSVRWFVPYPRWVELPLVCSFSFVCVGQWWAGLLISVGQPGLAQICLVIVCGAFGGWFVGCALKIPPPPSHATPIWV